MDVFGLGITINYVDGGAAAGLGGVATALSGVMGAASSTASGVANATGAINDALGSVSMMYAGKQAYDFGSKILNSVFNIGKTITEVGSTYEKSRLTLTALYGDVDTANEKIESLFDYSARTPFEMKNLLPAFSGLKAMGIEADKTVTSINGVDQELLSFIGDLQVFRGIPMDQLMIGIRNAFSGQMTSLNNRLDVKVDAVLGRKMAAGDPEQFAQDIADLAAALNVDGLMASMAGTWEQGFANMQDRMEYFIYVISEAGIFPALRNIQQKFVEFFEGISGADLVEIAQGVNKAFAPIIKILDDAAESLIGFAEQAVELLKQNPEMIAGFLRFAMALGTTAVALGSFLKVAGGLGIFLNGVNMLRAALPGAMANLLKFGLVAGLLFAAWQTDFLGLRTNVEKTVDSITKGFDAGQAALEGNYNKLHYYDNREDFFGNLIKNAGLARIGLQALFELWTKGAISDDTFQAMEEFGLTDLIEKIDNAKVKIEKFFEGFGTGAQVAFDNIKEGVEGALEPLKKFAEFFGLEDMSKFLDDLTNMDFDSAEKLGIAVGELGTYAAGVWALTAALGALGKVTGLGHLAAVLIGGGGATVGGGVGGGGLIGGLGSLIKLAAAHPVLTLLAAALVGLGAAYMQIEGATVEDKWKNLNENPNKALGDNWMAQLYEASGFTTAMDKLLEPVGGLEGAGLEGIWGNVEEGQKKTLESTRKFVGKLAGNQEFANRVLGYEWMDRPLTTGEDLKPTVDDYKTSRFEGQSMSPTTENSSAAKDVKKSFMDVIKEQWENVKRAFTFYDPTEWSMNFDPSYLVNPSRAVAGGLIAQGAENYTDSYSKDFETLFGLFGGKGSEDGKDVDVSATAGIEESISGTVMFTKDEIEGLAETSARDLAIIEGNIDALRIANELAVSKIETSYGEMWEPIKADTKSAIDDIILEIQRLDGLAVGVSVKVNTEGTGNAEAGGAKEPDIPGFASGGEIFGNGLAFLHDNEYVVNSSLTGRLTKFLDENQSFSGTESRVSFDEAPRMSVSDMFPRESDGDSMSISDDSGTSITLTVESGAIQVNGTSLNQDQLTASLTRDLWDNLKRLLEKENMRKYRGLKEGAAGG